MCLDRISRNMSLERRSVEQSRVPSKGSFRQQERGWSEDGGGGGNRLLYPYKLKCKSTVFCAFKFAHYSHPTFSLIFQVLSCHTHRFGPGNRHHDCHGHLNHRHPTLPCFRGTPTLNVVFYSSFVCCPMSPFKSKKKIYGFLFFVQIFAYICFKYHVPRKFYKLTKPSNIVFTYLGHHSSLLLLVTLSPLRYLWRRIQKGGSIKKNLRFSQII